MTEETQAQTTETEVTEPSLDDVISEYNVPETTPTTTTQPITQVQPQVQTQTPKVDPLDENSFNSYVQQVSSGQSVLNEQLQDVTTQLTELRQERAQLQVEADINTAVESINENLNLNPKLVRVHLEMTAQEKPGFKKIWENRKENPKAYEKALSAVGREMRDTYSVKTDENLASTQAAIQKSQQSMASTNTAKQTGTLEEKMANASDAEFQQLWNKAKSGVM